MMKQPHLFVIVVELNTNTMETISIERVYPLPMCEEDYICPYCGKNLEEIDGKLYCENCGVREI